MQPDNGRHAVLFDHCIGKRQQVEFAILTAARTVHEANQRGDLPDKRRRLMEAWASFCGDSTPCTPNAAVFLRLHGSDGGELRVHPLPPIGEDDAKGTSVALGETTMFLKLRADSGHMET